MPSAGSVDVESSKKHLTFDVPQGSVLGGPLSIMYVAPLPDSTETSGVTIRQFSDDS